MLKTPVIDWSFFHFLQVVSKMKKKMHSINIKERLLTLPHFLL
ncbi:hypothetical protein C2W59_00348 [Bacillus pumilus]|uniref:Uncharacterized protein n=1 Tax=Bacillus pumilus TaxID=1408 RepID=A0AB34R175_BACPU|nr:hypothetical protein B4127_2933 [Bacillus pumilus]RAP14300.1 hypothetical protein C2W58_02399 [Bacillus pumilus]RAP25386.1 hypothetical protein C2W59_00348 [Bacillus pumilus]